jgi:DNA helicase-2/ATP-dependent DNA helicase PcrA
LLRGYVVHFPLSLIQSRAVALHFTPGLKSDLPCQFPLLAMMNFQAQQMMAHWATRQPYRVEIPFERSIDGTILRGRMDAVYKNGDGTFDVVDWKTGSAKSGDELVNAAIQLAVYRLAFAEIEGISLEKVRAAFHYVSSEETVRPSDLLDYDGLLALINRVPVESK